MLSEGATSARVRRELVRVFFVEFSLTRIDALHFLAAAQAL
jgi:hypothetical protein